MSKTGQALKSKHGTSTKQKKKTKIAQLISTTNQEKDEKTLFNEEEE